MTLSEKRILEIIEEKEIITVKLDNKPLMQKLEKMEREGKIEFKDRYRDCEYYGKSDGREWSLKKGYL